MNLYEYCSQARTRWVSFENSSGARGQAGMENQGAKGHPSERLHAGQSRTLIDIEGSGTICRIWMTASQRNPRVMRGMRLDFYWDGCDTPAISVPFGDFFGVGLGRRCPFESQLFTDPEGRSFNCFVPMPFRKSARIVVTNESDQDLWHLFYEIDLLMDVEHSDDALYFHTHWRRESPNELGKEFDILPKVSGRGRFLGCNLGVIANPIYEGAWWGEGEFKVWFGDDEHATLCGTGTEDHIGTGWGQGVYSHRTQGCTIADEKNAQWAFYRYHIDDPIFFDDACRAAMQSIGGRNVKAVRDLKDRGVPLIPVTVVPKSQSNELVKLMDLEQPVDLHAFEPDGWCNFLRQDDWSGTAYFYLDRPESGLPPLQPADVRMADLIAPDQSATKRADE